MHVPALFDAAGQFQHGAFAHAVAEIIGPGGHEDRGHEAVFPVVVMREAAKGGFDSADNHRDIREEFLQYFGIDGDGIVRSCTGLSFRGVGIVMAQAL